MQNDGSILINRNMGCIEMFQSQYYQLHQFRLIETWDVLKFVLSNFIFFTYTGLIETWDVLKF